MPVDGRAIERVGALSLAEDPVVLQNVGKVVIFSWLRQGKQIVLIVKKSFGSTTIHGHGFGALAGERGAIQEVTESCERSTVRLPQVCDLRLCQQRFV